MAQIKAALSARGVAALRLSGKLKRSLVDMAMAANDNDNDNDNAKEEEDGALAKRRDKDGKEEEEGALAKRRKIAEEDAVALDLLACVACEKIMLPPLFGCTNGHLLCSACFGTVLDTCPTCRCSLRPMARALAVERLVAKKIVPCPFACDHRAAYDTMSEHVEICPRRTLTCDIGGCKATSGTAGGIVTHLMNEHGATLLQHPTAETLHVLGVFGVPMRSLGVFSFDDQWYALQSESHGRLLYVSLFTIGATDKTFDQRFRLRFGDSCRHLEVSGFVRFCDKRNVNEYADQVHEGRLIVQLSHAHFLSDPSNPAKNRAVAVSVNVRCNEL